MQVHVPTPQSSQWFSIMWHFFRTHTIATVVVEGINQEFVIGAWDGDDVNFDGRPPSSWRSRFPPARPASTSASAQSLADAAASDELPVERTGVDVGRDIVCNYKEKKQRQQKYPYHLNASNHCNRNTW
jgi:hypothetical protein